MGGGVRAGDVAKGRGAGGGGLEATAVPAAFKVTKLEMRCIQGRIRLEVDVVGGDAALRQLVDLAAALGEEVLSGQGRSSSGRGSRSDSEGSKRGQKTLTMLSVRRPPGLCTSIRSPT